ncbi:hypothetical protein E2C01_009583 [Portunus trituberculatus]|uniref:Uncharacterized protein n=1 Tax=Portunus trituberculatus TaxID=210409 RepID=A0A5B7D660_PORTR|nr:hypothetical protein [Portunus trituberculatus]
MKGALMKRKYRSVDPKAKLKELLSFKTSTPNANNKEVRNKQAGIGNHRQDWSSLSYIRRSEKRMIERVNHRDSPIVPHLHRSPVSQ